MCMYTYYFVYIKQLCTHTNRCKPCFKFSLMPKIPVGISET